MRKDSISKYGLALCICINNLDNEPSFPVTQSGGELAVTYRAATDLILQLSSSSVIKTKISSLFIMEFLFIFTKLWNFNYLHSEVKYVINRF